jgi:hypothetical protein
MRSVCTESFAGGQRRPITSSRSSFVMVRAFLCACIVYAFATTLTWEAHHSFLPPSLTNNNNNNNKPHRIDNGRSFSARSVGRRRSCTIVGACCSTVSTSKHLYHLFCCGASSLPPIAGGRCRTRHDCGHIIETSNLSSSLLPAMALPRGIRPPATSPILTWDNNISVRLICLPLLIGIRQLHKEIASVVLCEFHHPFSFLAAFRRRSASSPLHSLLTFSHDAFTNRPVNIWHDIGQQQHHRYLVTVDRWLVADRLVHFSSCQKNAYITSRQGTNKKVNFCNHVVLVGDAADLLVCTAAACCLPFSCDSSSLSTTTADSGRICLHSSSGP